jgi:hypothetical protein
VSAASSTAGRLGSAPPAAVAACSGALFALACGVAPSNEALTLFTQGADDIGALTEDASTEGIAADYYEMSANTLRDTLARRIVDAGGSTECQEIGDVRTTRVWSCTYSGVDGEAGVYEISMIVPAERVDQLEDPDARGQLADQCCSSVVMTFM